MNPDANAELPEIEALLKRAAAGDAAIAAAEIVDSHRTRLKRMVEARLDPRLRTRVDASDVLQEVSLEATQRFQRYANERPMPVFLWLRYLTAQRLGKLRRMHFGAHQRDLRRQVATVVDHAGTSTDCLAAHLAANQTSPSAVAVRNELRPMLESALEQIGEADREIISLRHYEQLSNIEAAKELGIEASAASKRYLRALIRLRELIGSAFDPQGLQ